MLNWWRKWRKQREALKIFLYNLPITENQINSSRRKIELLFALLDDKDYVLEQGPHSFQYANKNKEDYICRGNLEENRASLWVKKQPDRWKEYDKLCSDFHRFESQTVATLYGNANSINYHSELIKKIDEKLKGSKCKTKNG